MPKFLNRTRDKEVKIAPSFILFDYKTYDSFDRFLGEILPVIVEFGRVYKEVSFSRVGFRFLNRFDFDVEPSKMDWSKYFQSELVSVEKFVPDAEAVSRLLHLVEFNYEDGLLRFQFGQSNPDHPAPIRRSRCVWKDSGIREGRSHDRFR